MKFSEAGLYLNHSQGPKKWNEALVKDRVRHSPCQLRGITPTKGAEGDRYPSGCSGSITRIRVDVIWTSEFNLGTSHTEPAEGLAVW